MKPNRVYRSPAHALWAKTHKWGPQLGDSTEWWVDRTDGGEMRINDGHNTFTVRREMVEWVADAVAAAAAWSDKESSDE